MATARPRVAVACQGGGSHTAFSAGALKTLLASPAHDFVAFSGTSGGAIDALLAWYGLVADGRSVGRRLEAFWDDISAGTLAESVFNAWSLATYRLLSPVLNPEVSPYLYPEVASKELRATLERHVDFGAVPGLLRDRARRGPVPMLTVGAVDVRSGRFETFTNACPVDGGEPTLEVSADAVLASAAVPTLFRAVAVEKGGEETLCWDGLFSQNPPVRDLPEAQPDEIWVLQINPTARRTEPTQMGDIRDRRNELAGNLSLRQELHFIEKINKLVRGHKSQTGDATLETVEIDAQGTSKKRSYREITIRCIQIPEEAARLRLDTESKLDRSPGFIRTLFDLGEREAATFLAALPGDGYAWRDDG